MSGWRALGLVLAAGLALAARASAVQLVGAEFVAAGGAWNGATRLESALGQALPPGTGNSGPVHVQLGALAWASLPTGLAAPWLEIQALGPDLSLSWSPVPGALRYRVWTGVDWPGTPVLLHESPDTQWLDPGAATSEARRWYRVTALNTPLEETR